MNYFYAYYLLFRTRQKYYFSFKKKRKKKTTLISLMINFTSSLSVYLFVDANYLIISIV